jgi:hypothetical protein
VDIVPDEVQDIDHELVQDEDPELEVEPVQLLLPLLLRLPVLEVVIVSEPEPEAVGLHVPEPEEDTLSEPDPLEDGLYVALPLGVTEMLFVIEMEFVIEVVIETVAPEASLTRTRRRKVTRA